MTIYDIVTADLQFYLLAASREEAYSFNFM